MQINGARSRPRIALTVAGALFFAANFHLSHAADAVVNLTGSEETPPVTTSASATGTIRVTADRSISGQIKTSGLEGTAAHIHVGAPGESGPPIVTLVKGPNGTWRVPPGAKLTDQQYASFKEGNLYVNVHSAEHKGGELRAQLKP
jgi:CHRD domain